MKKIILPILLFVLTAHTTIAQDSLLQAKVSKMMELSGAKANFDVAIDQMIGMQKQNYMNILSDDYFDEFVKEAKTTGFEEISAQLVPIYLKHFTEAEIDGIIAFYESEVGRAMAEKSPVIMQESMQIGQQWGREMGMKIAQQLEEEAEKRQEKRN